MSSTPRRHGGHATLVALLASALFAPASAQAQDDQDHVSTAMAALLAAVVAVFVLIAAAIVYLRHCSGHAVRMSRPGDDDGRAAVVPSGLDAFLSWSWGQRWRRRSRGLDAEAIEAFPTMRYADAKALRVGAKGGVALECAVCLTEFEDEERLRLLLPRCCHAFHPDCIGEWLASHVTCPVCRCNLQPSNKETTSSDNEEPTSFPSIPEASSISSETAAAWRFAGPLPVGVVIDVVIEEEEEERRQEALELQRIGTQRRSMRSRSGLRPVTTTPQQLARWHSTGHSLAERLNRDLERFTLRLPEHVRTEMVAAAAEHSLQMRRGRRAGEGGGGRSAPLIGRLGRWQSIIGRTFFSASRITVSSGGGEVSSSSSTRVRGKRVVAVDDVADDVPAKGTGSESGAKAGAASCELEAADEEMAVKQKVRT